MKTKFYLVALCSLLFACKKEQKSTSESSLTFNVDAKLEAFKKGNSLSHEDIKNFVDYLNKSSAEDRLSVSKTLNEISSKQNKSISIISNKQANFSKVKTLSDENYALTTEQFLQQATFNQGTTPGQDPYGSIVFSGSGVDYLYNWTIVNSMIGTWRAFGVISHEICPLLLNFGPSNATFLIPPTHASSSIEGFAPGFTWTETSAFNYCQPNSFIAYFSCDGDLSVSGLGIHNPIHGQRFVSAPNVVLSQGRAY